MNLTNQRAAGWHTRGYLPHFDGRSIPQFITLHLADSLPPAVLNRWCLQLSKMAHDHEQLIIQQRIEKYLDLGYGKCLLRDPRVATIVQNSLLHFDNMRFNLFAWVVMPNHTHSLLTRFENWTLAQIMHSHKSYTSHQINKILERSGSLWRTEYFDRYIRNAEHFRAVVKYIENNPVKAGLCAKPSDWPYSSAYFRHASS